MLKRLNIRFLAVLFICILAACTKVPEGVVSQKTMESILYDSYIGEGLSETELVQTYDANARKVYFHSVLKKYGVTKQEYDSSLVWYMANLDVYSKMYDRVVLRLKKEESKLRLQSGDAGQLGKIAKGDTVNLWYKSNLLYFNELPLIGNSFVEIKNDDSFVLGDSIQFTANIRIFNHSTAQLPRMVLTIGYQNDTLKTNTETISQSRSYSIKVKADTTQKINYIQAGFYQNQPSVFTIDRVKLLRIHSKKKVKRGSEN